MRQVVRCDLFCCRGAWVRHSHWFQGFLEFILKDDVLCYVTSALVSLLGPDFPIAHVEWQHLLTHPFHADWTYSDSTASVGHAGLLKPDDGFASSTSIR